jgi:hypothetical protein
VAVNTAGKAPSEIENPDAELRELATGACTAGPPTGSEGTEVMEKASAPAVSPVQIDTHI